MVAIFIIAHQHTQIECFCALDIESQAFLVCRIKLLGMVNFSAIRFDSKVSTIATSTFIIKTNNGIEPIVVARKRIYQRLIGIATNTIAERFAIKH